MGVSYNPRLVSDGMVLCFDPANQNTYPTNNPENLFLQSEDITSSSWSKNNSRIVNDLTTSPSGVINAYKVVEDTSNNFHFIAQSIGSISGTYTVSCYVKAAERYRGYLQLLATSGNATVFFNLQTGTITGGSGTTTITSFPNGWYRVTASIDFSGVATCYFVINDDVGNFVYTGNGSSGLYVWGLQVETGPTATAYTPTTTSPIRRTFRDLNSGSSSTLISSYGLNTTAYGVPVLEINNNGTTSTGQVQVNTQVDLDYLARSQNFTVMFAAKKNFFGLAGSNNGNSQLFQGATNGHTTGWRISEGSGGTPGNAFTARHAWGLGYNDINTSLYINDSGSVNRMCICAFTVSPTTIFGFVNGNTNSRSNPGTYASGTSTPRISFTGAGAGSFNGLLGYFAIYNRALSQTEIEQNYAVLRTRYGI